jgi:RNase H-fold protein (predicted Holliday junction resolvase)
MQDERLSSFGAEQKLAPANFTKGKMRQRLDAVAAAEILNAFLEQKTSVDPTGTDTA